MTKTQQIQKSIVRYFLAFFLFLAVGFLLLFLSGFVPQHAVIKNVTASVEQLEIERYNARILDNSSSIYQLDIWTDARILLQALYMDTSVDPQTILTNAFWDNPEGMSGNAVDSLVSIRDTSTMPKANKNYLQYCMGFRIFVRPLLALGSITLLRQVIAWAMTILFFFVAAGFLRRTGMPGALMFIINYLALNPIVLMSSPQYASCIFIAFIGMIALLYFPCTQKHFGMLMFLLGTATQFFDFFTYPLLTALLPLCTYLLLDQKSDCPSSVKTNLFCSIKGLMLWGVAYVAVMIFKLGIVEVLTQEAAFASALIDASDWAGPAATAALSYGSKWEVLYHCARTFFVKTPMNLIILLILAVMWIGKLFSSSKRKEIFLQSICYIIPALIPLVYIIVFARHADVHMFFQYRTLGGSFFAACCATTSAWISTQQRSRSI